MTGGQMALKIILKAFVSCLIKTKICQDFAKWNDCSNSSLFQSKIYNESRFNVLTALKNEFVFTKKLLLVLCQNTVRLTDLCSHCLHVMDLVMDSSLHNLKYGSKLYGRIVNWVFALFQCKSEILTSHFSFIKFM